MRPVRLGVAGFGHPVPRANYEVSWLSRVRSMCRFTRARRDGLAEIIKCGRLLLIPPVALRRRRARSAAALAEALDITRFEVYEGYLDEGLYHPRRVRG